MNILALILSIGLGFGLSCLMFASILSKSNDIGNSVAVASHYKMKHKFDRSMHRMTDYDKKEFNQKYMCDEYFREEVEKAKSGPASYKLVERKEKMYNMPDGIDDSDSNLERR